MLSLLQIENVAVIKRAEILFEPGFNVLTGETGAGKSIVIDSLGAITGQRVSRDLIRSGSDCAKICALFSPVSKSAASFLEENGFDLTEEELILSREIHLDGRNICRINGQMLSVSQLKKIGNLLLNIHGQHDTQQLISDSSHLQYLDEFGGLDALVKEYQEAYHEYQQLNRELTRLDLDEQEKERKIERLSYEIQEIEEASLIPGEEEELIERRRILQNAERINDAMQRAVLMLFGDDDLPGGLSSVEEAVNSICNLQDVGGEYVSLGERLMDLQYELQDAARTVRDLQEQFDYTPEELNAIEDRLDQLYRLKRKYGVDVLEILAYGKKAQQELDQITHSQEQVQKLTAQMEEQLENALRVAEQLRKKRLSAARELTEKILQELLDLDMGKVRFAVEIVPREGQKEECLTETGADNVRFLFSANRGEEPRPLSKIASGGELARIMLALKNVLTEGDEVGTLVFDEVDAGVSGRAAQKVAMKLHQVAHHRQVLCVTHLPQITAKADVHFLIEKHEKNDRTETCVEKLDHNGRVHELARMIGGEQITETTLKSAEELLKS